MQLINLPENTKNMQLFKPLSKLIRDIQEPPPPKKILKNIQVFRHPLDKKQKRAYSGINTLRIPNNKKTNIPCFLSVKWEKK